MAMAVIPSVAVAATATTSAPLAISDDATYTAINDATATAEAAAAVTDRIIVPLEYQPDLRAYVIHY